MSDDRNRHFYVIGPVAFVRIPHWKNAWFRTDACVPFVGCPYPTCKVGPGVPCKGVHVKHQSSCHQVRRELYNTVKKELGVKDKTRIVHIAEGE